MNRDGFGRALREHGDRVCSYATWLLGDQEEGRDVAQEGLMRLWARRSEVAEESSRSWLLRTVHRLCMDRFRRRAIQREVSADEVGNSLPAPSKPVEQIAALSDLQSAIRQAMDRLSPRDRAMLIMREMQDMPCQEIARVLEMNANTLRPALRRARERLRQELARAGVQP